MFLKSKECPLLSETVLAELKKGGIKTVVAFLSRDAEALIHACSLTYQVSSSSSLGISLVFFFLIIFDKYEISYTFSHVNT